MKRVSSVVLAALVVGAGYGAPSTALGGLNADELTCEEAVAHLAQCCPSFDPHAHHCEYATGCGGTIYPEISEADGRYILSQSCADLDAHAYCALPPDAAIPAHY